MGEYKKRKGLKRKFSLKQSMSTKLIVIYVIIITLISVMLSSVAVYGSRNSLFKMAHDDFTKVLTVTSDLAREKIVNNITVLDNLAMDKDITNKNLKIEDKVKLVSKFAKSNSFKRVGIADKEGNLLFSDGSLNIKDREYFKDSINGSSIASDPMKSINPKDNGEMVIVYSSPIKSGEEIIGVLVGISGVDDFSKIVSNIKVGKTGEVYIFDTNGVMVANKDASKIGKLGIDTNSNDSKLKEYNEVAKKMLSGKSGYGEYKLNGEKIFTVYAPMEGSNWVISISINEDEILSGVKTMQNIMVVAFLIAMILSIIFIITQSKKMSKVLKRTVMHLNTIAEGDMTLEFDEKTLERHDEFGEMTRAMEKMQQSIGTAIKGMKNNATEIESHAENLANISEEMSSSADTVAGSIQDVAKGTNEQSEDINDMVTILLDFNDQIEQVMKSTDDLGTESNKISVLSEESNNDMGSISKSVSMVNDSFEKLVDKVNSVELNVGKINEITTVINSIAEQTNLLALNAAIEAARAGEVGKGFAVVADEIRNLAEQSKISATDINKLLESVFNETNDMVSTTSTVKNEIMSQGEIIEKAISSFEKINIAVEDMKPMIEKNMQVGQDIISGKEEILNRIQSASSVSQEVSASSEEISAITQEVNSATENVADSAKSLANMTKDMKESIDKFKVE